MKKIRLSSRPPERIDEAMVRSIAAVVSLLAALSLLEALTHFSPELRVLKGVNAAASVIQVVLAFDFLVRAAGASRLSPLLQFSRSILIPWRLTRFSGRMILLRPKRFAAWIGFLLVTAALTGRLFQLSFVPVVAFAFLALFSFLEAAFRFCAGCRIFALLIRLGLAREELCQECVLPGGDGI